MTYQPCQEVQLQSRILKRILGPREKSSFCHELSTTQGGGPIWMRVPQTYHDEVPKLESICGNGGEICIIKRIDILELTTQMEDPSRRDY